MNLQVLIQLDINMIFSFNRKLLVTLLAFLLASCSLSQDRPKITTVQLKFEIVADANPDERKRASPVVVAMHQLRNGNSYLQASLIKLFQSPSVSLGADFISTQKFGPYFPGTMAREKIILNDETNAVGFLAELSDFEAANARALVQFNSDDEEVKINVRVDKSGIVAFRREE